MTFGRELDRIYWGDFDHVHLHRDSLEFGLMMSSYMQDFGVTCAEFLPKNKVEITAQECVEESYWVNGYGAEKPGSRTCTRYRTYGTGVYADPELYDASGFEAGKMATALLGQLFSTMSKTGDAGVNAAMGNYMQSLDVARQATQFKADLQLFLKNNACGGAPLKRFEKNLIAFATERAPVRMAGVPAYAGPSRDSDYQSLLEDLVEDQSKGWLLNRYVSQSTANISVDERDRAGQPTSISANYAYTGSKGRIEGRVSLKFEDGVPHCLIFSDIPDACRPVSHKLAAAYEDGKYVTDHPAGARSYVAPDLRQVDVWVNATKPVLVEIPAKALTMPQDRVFALRGKLLEDVTGDGPDGGKVVLVHAGSSATLSVFNTERGVEFHLARVGDGENGTIEFANTSRQFPAGETALPHDGSPLRVSFSPPAHLKKSMMLTDYQQKKVPGLSQPVMASQTATLSPAEGAQRGRGGALPSPPSAALQRMLPAGTILRLQFATAIAVDQIVPGRLFAATLIPDRVASLHAERGEALPEGTTVFMRIT